MTYVHDKSKSKLPLGKVLDKGFNITSEDNKKTVANTHVIDTNKRKVSDKVNKSEPSFTE